MLDTPTTTPIWARLAKALTDGKAPLKASSSPYLSLVFLRISAPTTAILNFPALPVCAPLESCAPQSASTPILIISWSDLDWAFPWARSDPLLKLSSGSHTSIRTASDRIHQSPPELAAASTTAFSTFSDGACRATTFTPTFSTLRKTMSACRPAWYFISNPLSKQNRIQLVG